MASLNPRQRFDPLDLELINRVYEAAYAYIEARDLTETRIRTRMRKTCGPDDNRWELSLNFGRLLIVEG